MRATTETVDDGVHTLDRRLVGRRDLVSPGGVTKLREARGHAFEFLQIGDGAVHAGPAQRLRSAFWSRCCGYIVGRPPLADIAREAGPPNG